MPPRKKAAPQEPAPQPIKIERMREPTEATRTVAPNILAQAAANAVGAPIPKRLGVVDEKGIPTASPVKYPATRMRGEKVEGPRKKPGRKPIVGITKAQQKKIDAAKRRADRDAAKAAADAAKAARKAEREANRKPSRPRDVKFSEYSAYRAKLGEELTDLLTSITPTGNKIGDYRKAAKITDKIMKCAYRNIPKKYKDYEEVTPKVRAPRKASSWVDHVKKVAAERGIKYSEALKVAGETYKK